MLWRALGADILCKTQILGNLGKLSSSKKLTGFKGTQLTQYLQVHLIVFSYNNNNLLFFCTVYLAIELSILQVNYF